MKKVLPLLLFVLLANTALADLSRAECQQRLEQALNSWRQGGQIWKARIEDDSAQGSVGNLYLQYPGKHARVYDFGEDFLCDGKTNGAYRGSEKIREFKPEEDTLWALVSGQIGSNVEVDMLDQESLNYYGEDLRVVVADLVTNIPKSDRVRVRLFIRGEGAPEILAVGYELRGNGYAKMWLRDFHQVTPKSDPFKRSVL